MWVRGSTAILATKRLAGVTLRAESGETAVCKQQSMQTRGCTQKSYKKHLCPPLFSREGSADPT